MEFHLLIRFQTSLKMQITVVTRIFTKIYFTLFNSRQYSSETNIFRDTETCFINKVAEFIKDRHYNLLNKIQRHYLGVVSYNSVKC